MLLHNSQEHLYRLLMLSAISQWRDAYSDRMKCF